MRVTHLYLTWLNYLGGFDYFLFNGFKDFNLDINQSGQVRDNIFPQWPKSYGSFADTIDKQTYRIGKKSIVVRSQNLSANQRDALVVIKTSPLVQIMNSRNDRRTVLVDTDSFKIYTESDKIYTISFKITYTDDIPSQKL